MRNKLLYMILAAVLCFSLLAGCSGAGGEQGSDPAASGESQVPYSEEDPDANDDMEDDGIDHDEGKTKGGDPIESINGKDDRPSESNDQADTQDTDNSEGSRETEADEPITEPALPDLTIAPEDLKPDDDFAGLFSNEEYTALITKGEDDMMVVSIHSAGTGKTAYEWNMSGYFSDENYRIRYSNAVKTVITLDKNGNEESRSTEYENGSGVIQFSDTDGFTWHNNMEPIQKTEFKKGN